MITKNLKFAYVNYLPENVKNGFVLILWLKKRGVVLYAKGSNTWDFTVSGDRILFSGEFGEYLQSFIKDTTSCFLQQSKERWQNLISSCVADS